MLKVYLVDDESLALKRLARLLSATHRVEIVGSTTDANTALRFLSANKVDVLFLDIQMPSMNGFEMLTQLIEQPPVIFTTAFDKYALNAFEVNSIDYLLKPIEATHLTRALDKLDRLRSVPASMNASLAKAIALELSRKHPSRIASRVGERIVFIELDSVTHFYAKDKLVFAATDTKHYIVDGSIVELEGRLHPNKFMRIHRSTLLNLEYVVEASTGFGGGMIVKLNDEKRTELTVARDRITELKKRLNC